MSTDEHVYQVGQLHIQLSELESKLERAKKEGLVMAEHLEAIAGALKSTETLIHPVLFANDDVFAIAGHKGEQTQRVGSREFPVSPYPNVKELIKRTYDLNVEKDKVRKELKDAENRAKGLLPWE